MRADVAMTPDNRSRGFGSVVFSNEEEAKKAIGTHKYLYITIFWSFQSCNTLANHE